ncbi:MAG TPA: hypothetical protein VHW95_16730 [Steroidobacteraceae bacterium]|jgi:hypothetical protein|nr:hypothetical protein [Steroidobacteraceae bacterium]
MPLFEKQLITRVADGHCVVLHRQPHKFHAQNCDAVSRNSACETAAAGEVQSSVWRFKSRGIGRARAAAFTPLRHGLGFGTKKNSAVKYSFLAHPKT